MRAATKLRNFEVGRLQLQPAIDYLALLRGFREEGFPVTVLPLVAWTGQHGLAACRSRASSGWHFGRCGRGLRPFGALGLLPKLRALHRYP